MPVPRDNPGQFNEDDWLEAVDNYSPNQYTISRNRSYCTLTGLITWAKLKPACTYLLGYAYTSGTTLKRRTPAWNPVFPWLSATQIINLVGIKFDGKEENLYIGLLDNATYEKVKITVAYEQLPWKVREDYQVANEWERWTVIAPRPYVQQLAVEGGQLVFANGPYTGRAILSTRPLVRMDKTALKVLWAEVPWSFVADSNDIMPKFLAAVGKVNSATFFGRDPGTLLLDGEIDVEKYIQPVATQTIGDFEYSANITMTLKYFNPSGGNGTAAGNGWNLWPGVDGNFYRTTTAIFSSYDFAKLFQHQSLP